MKKILLRADREISVVSVPDEVEENLETYCMAFCDWLRKGPDAACYRVKMGNVTCVRYDEKDFIRYLNQTVCRGKAALVATLPADLDRKRLPEEYADLPYFNF